MCAARSETQARFSKGLKVAGKGFDSKGPRQEDRQARTTESIINVRDVLIFKGEGAQRWAG
jgi:hypothetical protein